MSYTFKRIALAVCVVASSFNASCMLPLSHDTADEKSSVKVSPVPQFSSWTLPSGVTVTPIPPEENYSLFCLMRHGTTTKNAEKLIQGNSMEGDLILEPSLLMASCMYSQSPVFDKMYSGTNGRTSLTMQVISGKISDESCEKDARFNEQSLGICEGRPAREIMAALKTSVEVSTEGIQPAGEFVHMLKDSDYRMAETEVSKSETGNEVMNRMLEGLYDVAHQNPGKTICICSSQCTINWFYRWISGNKDKVLNIANLGALLFKYYIQRDQIQLVTPTPILFGEACERIRGMKAK